MNGEVEGLVRVFVLKLLYLSPSRPNLHNLTSCPRVTIYQCHDQSYTEGDQGADNSPKDKGSKGIGGFVEVGGGHLGYWWSGQHNVGPHGIDRKQISDVPSQTTATTS